MSSNNLKPPYSNTGVACTSNCSETPEFIVKNTEISSPPNLTPKLLIDWLQFTLHIDNKEHNKYDTIVRALFRFLFNIDDGIYFYDYGRYGYTNKAISGDIEILFSKDREDMGYHIQLTGKACRQFEEMGLLWVDLFKSIVDYDYNITRIDVAIDLFNGKYFSIDLLRSYLDKGLCVCKSIYYNDIKRRKFTDTTLHGDTLYFGSRSSNIYIVIYDKLRERLNSGYDLKDFDLSSWIRVELRIKNALANDFVRRFVGGVSLGKLTYGVIHNNVRFVVDGSDSNIRRRPNVQWWNRFLNGFSKISLNNIPYEPTLIRKKMWLVDSTSKSYFQVLLGSLDNIDIDQFSGDFIYKFLCSGYQRITLNDLKIVNDYRHKKGLNLLTLKDIDGFINDIVNIDIKKIP